MLVPDDDNTYWKIPAAGAYTWVAFDLGSEYTLTGLRLAGWCVYCYFPVAVLTLLVLVYCRGDKQMVHAFIVEAATSLA